MFRFGTGALDLPSPFPHEQDTLLVHVSSVIRPTESVDRTRKAQASNEQALNLPPNLVFRATMLPILLTTLYFSEKLQNFPAPYQKGKWNPSPLVKVCAPKILFC